MRWYDILFSKNIKQKDRERSELIYPPTQKTTGLPVDSARGGSAENAQRDCGGCH